MHRRAVSFEMTKLLIVFTPARRAKLQLRPQRAAAVVHCERAAALVHCERVAALVDRDVRSSNARRTVASWARHSQMARCRACDNVVVYVRHSFCTSSTISASAATY